MRFASKMKKRLAARCATRENPKHQVKQRDGGAVQPTAGAGARAAAPAICVRAGVQRGRAAGGAAAAPRGERVTAYAGETRVYFEEGDEVSLLPALLAPRAFCVYV